MARRGNPGLTVRLTAEQIERIKEFAEQHGLTTSELVREALKLYMLKSKPT